MQLNNIYIIYSLTQCPVTCLANVGLSKTIQTFTHLIMINTVSLKQVVYLPSRAFKLQTITMEHLLGALYKMILEVCLFVV